MPATTTSTPCGTRGLPQYSQKGKERKGIKIKKEETKLSLFAENFKESQICNYN